MKVERLVTCIHNVCVAVTQISAHAYNSQNTNLLQLALYNTQARAFLVTITVPSTVHTASWFSKLSTKSCDYLGFASIHKMLIVIDNRKTFGLVWTVILHGLDSKKQEEDIHEFART